MIKQFFKQNSVYSGVITDFHYQTDIEDRGIHFVTLKLDDGREVEAALQINDYTPYEIGQRICGSPFSAPIGSTDKAVDLSLMDISKIDAGQSPLITQLIMHPLRGIFEDLARAEARGMRMDAAMGKDAGKPMFGRWAYLAGSELHGETGDELPLEDQEAAKAEYADTYEM